MGAGEPANGAAPSQTDPIQETSRRSSTTHGRRSGRPPRLPDAVYDEIADALAAEAERMASLGSSPGTGTGLKAPKRTREVACEGLHRVGMTNRSEEVYVERKRPIETVGSAGTEAVAGRGGGMDCWGAATAS